MIELNNDIFELKGHGCGTPVSVLFYGMGLRKFWNIYSLFDIRRLSLHGFISTVNLI